MKERAAELRAEGNEGRQDEADGLQAVLDAIAKMAPEDRALGRAGARRGDHERPRPGAARPGTACPPTRTRDGKVVVFFQDAGKFGYRYSTLGFQEAAHLDDGDIWPVSYALLTWSPSVREAGRRARQGRRLLTGPAPAPPATASSRPRSSSPSGGALCRVSNATSSTSAVE